MNTKCTVQTFLFLLFNYRNLNWWIRMKSFISIMYLTMFWWFRNWIFHVKYFLHLQYCNLIKTNSAKYKKITQYSIYQRWIKIRLKEKWFSLLFRRLDLTHIFRSMKYTINMLEKLPASPLYGIISQYYFPED